MLAGQYAGLDPVALFASGLALGAALALGMNQLILKLRRRPWRPATRFWPHGDRRQSGVRYDSRPLRDQPVAKTPDAAEQLRIVMNADFFVQSLLNRSEVRVFSELERAVGARNRTWRVMAQVSLGEVLVCRDPEAYRCVNSKRVDLLLMDGEFQPRHAIEYQGGAHHQGSAAARDAIKKEALRRAGIGYHEIVAGFTTPSELRRLVDKLVDAPDVPPTAGNAAPWIAREAAP